jgi:acyl-coenzyme A thioesterase PaaI-like protein
MPDSAPAPTEPSPDPAPAAPDAASAEGGDPDPGLMRGVLRSRWHEPPQSVLTERRLELRRVAESLRLIIEQLVATAAPTDVIADAADELERVAASFKVLSGERDYIGFAEAANAGGEQFASFEHSPFIGRANPLAPPIRLEDVDGVVHGWATFGTAYEGPPGCVHGGYVAAAFDELLGAAQSLSGSPAMTGTLTVRYCSPTPLHTELHFIGELTRVEGRKIFTGGRLLAGDRLCAEGEAIFISLKVERFLTLMAERDERVARRQHH